MRPVVYRLRRILRSRRRSTVGLALVVAVLVGVVLVFAAGARRTLSAPNRYTAAQRSSFDALVYQTSERGKRSRVAELESVPGTAAAESMSFVFGRLTSTDHEDLAPNLSVFSGSPGPTGERLVAGREADPTKAGEFVATRSFVDATHASIGDEFFLETLTQDQADAAGFDNVRADGPSLTGVLVGVIDGPGELDDPNPFALFSGALLDDPTIGVAVSLIAVRIAPGTTLEDYQARLSALPDDQDFNVEPAATVGENLRAAVAAKGQGLSLLALLAAIAATVVLVQLATRQVRLSPAERARLQAIGMTNRQIVAESTGRAAVPIILGSVVGAAASTLASGWFPTGFVRRIEPAPGYRLDVAVAVLGALIAAAVLVVAVVAALIATSPSGRRTRPSATVEAVAPRLWSATAATGLRFAFTRRDGDNASARSTVAGLLLTIAGLIGVISFGSSLDRLVDQPARFGNNFDAQFDNGAETTSPKLLATLDDDPDIDSLSLYADGQAHVGSTLVAVLGFERIRGELAPEVLAGRLPASDDEVAFGRLAARDLGIVVGASVLVQGDEQPRTMRVTGLVAVPNIGFNDGVGQGAVFTLAGMRRLIGSAQIAPTPVVRLRPGAPAGTLDRLGQVTGVAAARGSLPPAIVNVARVRTVPFWLAALLVALAALTVGHAMITSLRNRRRDLAVLLALGADRSWITRVIHWHATAVASLPAVLGLPLGIVAGRFVFAAFADRIGARNDASVPWSALLVVIAGVVVLANVTAALPGRWARRITPTALLRVD